MRQTETIAWKHTHYMETYTLHGNTCYMETHITWKHTHYMETHTLHGNTHITLPSVRQNLRCDSGSSNPALCDNLEGWGGMGDGSEVQESAHMHTYG